MSLDEHCPVNERASNQPEHQPAAAISDQYNLRVCVHRGARQIGGSCVELCCEGKHLLLDIGLPLDSDGHDPAALPDISGLDAGNRSLLGVVISHAHSDHCGLADRLPKETVFLMGAATERILAAAAEFTPYGGKFENVIHLEDRKPIELGPFQIVPFLMDHSAYDAYSVLIAAGGRRLFYTGDLRAHGRKGKLFERLLRRR